MHMVVRDDGIGFDVAAARERAEGGASLGLPGMRAGDVARYFQKWRKADTSPVFVFQWKKSLIARVMYFFVTLTASCSGRPSARFAAIAAE